MPEGGHEDIGVAHEDTVGLARLEVLEPRLKPRDVHELVAGPLAVRIVAAERLVQMAELRHPDGAELLRKRRASVVLPGAPHRGDRRGH